MLTVSDRWRETYPGASQGLLVMKDVRNPEHHPALEARKAALESGLRERFAGRDRRAITALPSIQPYVAYYARFRKTYHVQLQLESVALKGKSLPRVAALVEAMFMAELEHHLLTAGHDLDSLRLPLRLDVAEGDERYTLLNGREETVKGGDMFIADAAGVTSSVVHGPDQRTRITTETRHVLFTSYAPPGVPESTVREHLAAIEANVRLVAPDAETVAAEIYRAEATSTRASL